MLPLLVSGERSVHPSPEAVGQAILDNEGTLPLEDCILLTMRAYAAFLVTRTADDTSTSDDDKVTLACDLTDDLVSGYLNTARNKIVNEFS